jgi:acetyl-CoA carboxylase carboxyltransferase component
MCDAFNLPIVTLVDTPGYFPGKDLEWRGIIRKGAQLAFAYAEATVPRVCVIMRKSYGGAYIVMDSKRMGNDVCVAWPSAEVAVMGAQQAVQVLYRNLDDAGRAEKQVEFERMSLTPYIAAERGYVDLVIDPAQTRAVLSSCLGQLESKREHLTGKKHSNTPL